MCPYVDGHYCELKGKNLPRSRVATLCESAAYYYECPILNEADKVEEDEERCEEERRSSDDNDDED